MKLIEDIRNRGYKGFDHLPHYDLTPSFDTLDAFSRLIGKAYARPIHNNMTVGYEDGNTNVLTHIKRMSGSQLDAWSSETNLQLDFPYLYGYTATSFCETGEKNTSLGRVALSINMLYDISWSPVGAIWKPTGDIHQLSDEVVKEYPFTEGVWDESEWSKSLSECIFRALKTFFALCHTQGVEIETHTHTPKQVRGFRRKNRKVPRDFKTMKLPAAIQEAFGESEETGNKLDQPHFRRGHLKTAKSPRYKVKNWWTESHIVGKDAPGKLITDTKVIK
jgi:hypothetical protein